MATDSSAALLTLASAGRLAALALRRDVAKGLKQLSRTQWLSLTVLLVTLWRCRRDLQREAFSFMGFLEDVLRTLTGRSVQKNFLNQSPQLKSSCKFSDFNEVLPKWLSEGLKAQNFQDMKPIQRKVLPLALGGHDVVATAPTGSGKTLAFLVPAMVHASSQSAPSVSDGPIVLVLAPTRELVLQIHGVAELLCRRGNKLNAAAVYGGQQRMEQLSALRRHRSVHLLVATVGRLLDFLHEFRAFRLRRCSFLVLDEGDKMLADNFEEEIVLIGSEARRDKQVLFFSATWPPSVERAARRLCSRGSGLRRITLEEEETEERMDGRSLPPGVIEQLVEIVKLDNHDHKLPILLSHLEEANLSTPLHLGGGKVLVFVKTRLKADELATLVLQKWPGSTSDAIHGQRTQQQRERSLRDFRNGSTRALITTDVLGRGVDIPDVSLVFIYDFPDDIETYIHRVGRTGRNGKPGKAVSLFVPQYWNSYMANELQDVLEGCQQYVPPALQEAAVSSAYEGWNSSWNSGWNSWRHGSEPK